jgi:hypothetical protein
LTLLPLSESDVLSAAEAGHDPIRQVCEAPPDEALQSQEPPPGGGPAEQLPAVILVEQIQTPAGQPG